MDPHYFEVQKLLGQSDLDQHLLLLTRALQSALPGLQNNNKLEQSALLWSTRNRTWPDHLHDKFVKRSPPVYCHQYIVILCNSYNVKVSTVNKQCDLQMDSL